MRLNANRKSISMISSITNQGKVRFMVYKDAMNADLFIKFMGRLLKDAGRKVFLVVDNLRTHHSKPVKEWLDEHKDEIEVFYLPSYSPELNPDEYLNCDMKAAVHSGLPARNEKELKTNSSHTCASCRSCLNGLQNTLSTQDQLCSISYTIQLPG